MSSSCPGATTPAPSAPAAVSPRPAATGVPGRRPHSVGRLAGEPADELGRGDDPRQPVGIDADLLGELPRPGAGGRVGEPAEVEVRRVGVRVGAGQPAQPPGDVGARDDEADGARVLGGPVAAPPEDLRRVGDHRRTAGARGHLVAETGGDLLHLGAAAGVEPGVVRRRRAAVGGDSEDARHLPRDRDARHVAGVAARAAHALGDRLAGGAHEVLGVLLDVLGAVAMERQRQRRLGEAGPVGRVEAGLRALRADVDAGEEAAHAATSWKPPPPSPRCTSNALRSPRWRATK